MQTKIRGNAFFSKEEERKLVTEGWENWVNDPIWEVLLRDYRDCMKKQKNPILFMLENKGE